MNSIFKYRNAEASSNEPSVVEVVVKKPNKRNATQSPELAALNARISANRERIMRAAEANTLRLTGKPSL